jgi:polysaccharide pyruvyl transferase WcaK-like protein
VRDFPPSRVFETSASGELAMASQLRVALIGGYGGGNFGNDASLEAALGLLRKVAPDADYECICSGPSRVTARFGVSAHRLAYRPGGFLRLLDTLLLRLPSGLFNWIRAFWLVGRFDVLVWAGTGVFDDYRTGPLGFPAQVFRWSVAARLRRTKLIFLSVGAGPIINPLSRFFLKAAAICANHRSYRDEDSRRFMQSMGVDEQASPVFPDVAFALSPPLANRANVTLTVGVGVMAYRGWRRSAAIESDYSAKLLSLIGALRSRGLSVRYLVAEDSDARALADLKQRLPASQGAADEEPMSNLHDVMRVISACDIVVGSRYHVLVAGLKARRPCVSLGYGPKHQALLESAGIGQFSQAADDFDLPLLIAQIEAIVADLEHYKRTVATSIDRLEANLSGVDAFLRQSMSNGVHKAQVYGDAADAIAPQ